MRREALRRITFEISGAPIGIALPDIAFNANFAQSTLLENNATFTTRTYISGSGDCRAYDETHGNMAGITVQAAITGGTAMNKVVSDSYIELDEDFTYTVSYTNGDEPSVSCLLLRPSADEWGFPWFGV